MGLLADVFSYGDTLKRRLGGLLSDPAGTVDLGVRRFAEDQNKLLGLMDQSGYTPGAQSVLQTPQDKAQARNQLAEAALNTYGGLLGGTLWHGGNLVQSPQAFKQGVSTRSGPSVSATPSMLEAARYSIHNAGPINAIDDAGLKIYKRGEKKALDAAYKAGNFQAIRDAGYDGVKLFHSNEHVLFDPKEVLRRSKVVANPNHSYGEDGIVRHFERVGASIK